MNIALNQALQDPALREKIIQSGAEVRGSTVQEYAAFLQTESQRWGKAIKDAGLKPE